MFEFHSQLKISLEQLNVSMPISFTLHSAILKVDDLAGIYFAMRTFLALRYFVQINEKGISQCDSLNSQYSMRFSPLPSVMKKGLSTDEISFFIAKFRKKGNRHMEMMQLSCGTYSNIIP